MKTVAGVVFPCFDCKNGKRCCGQKTEIMKQVFFAIGTGADVNCADYEEVRYHGLEGVKA